LKFLSKRGDERGMYAIEPKVSLDDL